MRNLTIPNELVGIHRGIGITTTAVHTDIRCKLSTPRQVNRRVQTIGESPGVKVRLRLQLIASLVVVHRTVKFHFQPIVTIATTKTSTNVVRVSDIPYRLLILHNITHTMIVLIVQREVVAEVAQ